MPLEIGFPGELGHNNSVRAIVDSNFVRGGIRRVSNLASLYLLSSLYSDFGQIDEYRTLVWVDDQSSFYQLVDGANANAESGWEKLSTTNELEITATITDGVLFINTVEAGQVVGADGVGISSIVDNEDGTFTINLTDDTSSTIQTIQGQQGDDGISAYEVWQGISGNEAGTVQDFINDISGADGADGSDGEPGIDGNTILSGTANPQASLGQDGDFYINTSTFSIFGPKTSGSWGSASSLVGSQGPPGEDGGTPTVTVTPAVTTLPYGSNASVASNTTSTGINLAFSVPAGQDGAPGEDGVSISSVSVEQSGDLLVNFSDGSTTNAGNVVGADGVDGLDGASVLSGAGAPSSGLGDIGDFYIDTSNSEIYGPKIEDGWGSGTSLIGPQGPPGESGIDGSPFLSQDLEVDVETSVSIWFSRVRGLTFDTTQTTEDVLRAMFVTYIPNSISSGYPRLYADFQESPGTNNYTSGASNVTTVYVEYGRGCFLTRFSYKTVYGTEKPIQNSTFKVSGFEQSLQEEIVATTSINTIELSTDYEFDTAVASRFCTLQIFDEQTNQQDTNTASMKRYSKPYVVGSLTSNATNTGEIQQIINPVFTGTSENFLDEFANTAPPSDQVSFTATGNAATDNYFVYIIYPVEWGLITAIQRGNEVATTDFSNLDTHSLLNKWSSSANYTVYKSIYGKPFNEDELVTITFAG